VGQYFGERNPYLHDQYIQYYCTDFFQADHYSNDLALSVSVRNQEKIKSSPESEKEHKEAENVKRRYVNMVLL